MGAPGYSGWTVVLDPSAIDSSRVELDINSAASDILIGGTSSGQGPDWGTAEITAYESQQGQYGNTVSAFVYPNRTVTIPLGVMSEAAFSNLRQKVALFQREGGSLLRQRLGGDAMYLDVVNASLSAPDNWLETAGIEPNVVLTLECLPDFYGDEITLDTITATGYCDAVLQQDGVGAVIGGDYPARCRIIVTDTSGAPQEGLFWSFRSRYYASESSAALVIPASDLTVQAGGSLATVAGSYNTQVVQATLSEGENIFIVDMQRSAAALTHLGTYRVIARVYSTTDTSQTSLTWGPSDLSADDGWTDNAAVTSVEADFWGLVDLGSIRIAPTPVGSTDWSGFIGVSSPSGASTVSLDYVMFVPLDDSAGFLSWFPAIYADSSVEVRSDGCWTEQSAAIYRPTGGVTGDLPRLPVSGMEGRPTEILVKNSRQRLFTFPDPNIDSFTVQIKYRPCWMFRP